MLNAENFATFVLGSYRNALIDFDRMWRSGWNNPTPAHEQACAGRVATELFGKYGDELEFWNEIPIKHILRREKLENPFPQNSAFDLAALNRENGRIYALVEFKTHSYVANDIQRLEKIRNLVPIENIIIAKVIDIKFKTDAPSAEVVERMDNFFQAERKEMPNWAFTERAEPFIIREEFDNYLITPFVAWLPSKTTL